MRHFLDIFPGNFWTKNQNFPILRTFSMGLCLPAVLTRVLNHDRNRTRNRSTFSRQSFVMSKLICKITFHSVQTTVELGPKCDIINVNDHYFYSSNRKNQLAPNHIEFWSWSNNALEDLSSSKLHHVTRSYDSSLNDCHSNTIKISANDNSDVS